jgi:hypothetical protein
MRASSSVAPGFEPPAGEEIARVRLLCLPGRERQRRPDVNIFHPQPRARRRHAYHRVKLIIERDGPAQDVWIAAEAPLPQNVAENHYPVMSGLIFFRQKIPADHRPQTDHGKKAMSNEPAAYPLGICFIDQVKRPAGHGLECREHRVLLLPGEECGR